MILRFPDRHGTAPPGGLRTLAALVALALVAACGGASASPSRSTPAGLRGDFIAGSTSRALTWVALSTDGHRVIAFACDGSPDHPPTFAEWFSGQTSNGIVDLRSSHGARLVTSLTARSTTGTVQLSSGTIIDFTLTPIRSRGQAGLFRSEQTLNGVSYLAGWVLPPPPAQASPSPAASPSASPSSASSSKPSPPAAPGRRRSAPSPTPTPLPTQGGAVIDESSGALLAPPDLDARALSTRQVQVPKVGALTVTYCVEARCE